MTMKDHRGGGNLLTYSSSRNQLIGRVGTGTGVPTFQLNEKRAKSEENDHGQNRKQGMHTQTHARCIHKSNTSNDQVVEARIRS